MGLLTALLLSLASAGSAGVPPAASAGVPPARPAGSAGVPPAPASVWQNVAWTDLEGREWTREALEGRVVLLDFWATWCAPCLAELPRLKALHERHAGRGFVLLGVALDTIDRRRLRSFLHRHGVGWPQVHETRGTGGDAARAFGVEAVPSTVLVDRSGRIVARDFRGPALEATVETLLDLRPGE